jgi:ankyrin repeat protein
VTILAHQVRQSGYEMGVNVMKANKFLAKRCWTGIMGVVVCLLTGSLGLAAPADATTTLQKGLFEEEANHNLEAAIQAYQTVIAQFDKDRKLAATAIFRLGECYRKQGDTKQANMQYERILREFADQTQLAALSRQNLGGSGAELGGSPVAASSAAREEQKRLLGEEIKLVEQKLARQQRQVTNGVISGEDLLPTQRELLQLERQMVALEAGGAFAATPGAGAASEVAAAEAEAARLRAQLDHLSQLTPEQRRVAVQQDFPNPVLTSLMQELGQAEQKLVGLQKDYGPEHPEVKKTEALVETTQKQIDAQVRGVVAGLEARLGAAKATVAALAQAETKPGASGDAKAGGAVPATATEAEEVKRIQAMIKDSPDLINARMSGSEGWNGWTPLQKAAYQGQMVVAQFLLANGADVSATQSGGQTALHLAAQKGHAAMAILLLSKKAEVNPEDNEGKTPLHLAAENGFRTVAQTLLDRGADVNARTKSDATPLHLAAYNGFKSVAELLISRGAEVNALGAARNEPSKVRSTALHMVARSGDQALAELLVTNKADIKAADSEGTTPLHIAAEAGQIPIATLLLAHGAEVNVKGLPGPKQGWTPLYCAVNWGKPEMVAFLLKNKADPNTRVDGGVGARTVENTALLLATARFNSKCVDPLLSAKADVDAKNTSGLAAILLPLTYSGSVAEANAIVRALLEHGASPEAKDPRTGATPLMKAVEQGNQELVQVLLEHKAAVNAKDITGRTALQYAARWSGSRNMVAIGRQLVGAGADINARDNNGNTALVMTGRPPRGAPSNQAEFADFLREHGAVEDLPLLDRIEIRRPSANYRATVFAKGTNDYNHFTIFELLAAHYGFISTSSDAVPIQGHFERESFTVEKSLAFPDLAHVLIRRPVSGGTDRMVTDPHLGAALSSGNCAGDVALQWGDVVEIPEADHPISAVWQGLSAEDLALLNQCLKRVVQVTVKGQSTNVVLSAQTRVPGQTTFGPFAKIYAQIPQFSLWPVLVQSGLLRASSDLSRVKVRRRDSQSGQIYELLFDCSDPHSPPDFWLRNGDEVNVAEKAERP